MVRRPKMILPMPETVLARQAFECIVICEAIRDTAIGGDWVALSSRIAAVDLSVEKMRSLVSGQIQQRRAA